MLVLDSLGRLPPPSQCSDLVGQIQQMLNAAHAAGKLSQSVPGVFPLTVDGRAGQQTNTALDTALAESLEPPRYPNWNRNLPGQIHRLVELKYGPMPSEPYRCGAPPPSVGSQIPWTWIAGGVGLAVLGIVLAKAVTPAPAPAAVPSRRPAPIRRPVPVGV